MPPHRFYCPSLAVGINELPADEAHHAATVMRSRAGDAVELFNGLGVVASGVVEQVARRGTSVRVERTHEVPFELRSRLTLAVAMSKAHRQGYLVEKCTELGVSAIWPVIAARSVTQPGEAAVEKWSRRAVEAAKQSGRAWVPIVAPVVSFADALSRAREFPVALFCDLGAQAVSVRSALGGTGFRVPGIGDRGLGTGAWDASMIAFVGPEGGWTDEERRAANDAGLISVMLSPTILRAETAAVAMCAAVAAHSAESVAR
jgi:16S rRNA (uracil1498-N3)-methyltransferase